MSRRLTTEEFVERAKKIHKDKKGNPLYDYSKVNYVSCRTKVEIICPKHGSFWQTPADHLRGKGCRKCGMIKLALERRKSKEEFVKQALEIHKDKYDYSLVEYVNNRTKVKIVCRKCDRVFEITPKALLRGQGCPYCATQKGKKKERLTKEEFIVKANKIHQDKYDYTLVDYKGKDKKVKIICKNCGRIFEITPKLLLKGSGCRYCYTNIKDTRKFIEEARRIHGNKYDYSLVDYKGCFKKVKIKCNVCGKVFNQAPHAHLQGRGCSYCAREQKRLGLSNFI